ncbi:MAG: hypothetical protein IKI64_06630 [Clostridia bacterium]|nr:hypothetical protein [Clostridia bacterium]
MYISFSCGTDEVRRAAHIWRQRIAAFEAAPPEEAAIAALELEAAERRHMLALRQARTACAAAPSRNKGEVKVKVKSKDKSKGRIADRGSILERAKEHKQTQRNATKNIAKE